MDNPYQIKTCFTVFEAACALADITQPSQSDNFVLQTMMKELQDAIKADELSAKRITAYQTRRVRGSLFDDERIEKIPTGTDWGRSTIARPALLTWCEQRGVRPALLFPEQPADKPLHASERATLLAIIRALAELHGIKPDSGAYRKEAIALLEELASKGFNHPCEEKTLSKHLANCFKSR